MLITLGEFYLILSWGMVASYFYEFGFLKKQWFEQVRASFSISLGIFTWYLLLTFWVGSMLKRMPGHMRKRCSVFLGGLLLLLSLAVVFNKIIF